jgi:hypothetical protein
MVVHSPTPAAPTPVVKRGVIVVLDLRRLTAAANGTTR